MIGIFQDTLRWFGWLPRHGPWPLPLPAGPLGLVLRLFGRPVFFAVVRAFVDFVPDGGCIPEALGRFFPDTE